MFGEKETLYRGSKILIIVKTNNRKRKFLRKKEVNSCAIITEIFTRSAELPSPLYQVPLSLSRRSLYMFI